MRRAFSFCDLQLEEFKKSLNEEILETLDLVYNKYIPLSAFELVILTHSELPWKRARRGLKVTEMSSQVIEYEDILKEYLN